MVMNPNEQAVADAERKFWQKFHEWEAEVKDASRRWSETESARSALHESTVLSITDINRFFTRTVFRRADELEAELDDALRQLNDARGTAPVR